MTKSEWPEAAYLVHLSDESTIHVAVKGRDRWALENLILAGERGCTPIDHPGPRWSAYVFKLRQAGLEIETVTESHVGPFPGHHARYRLKSRAMPLRQESPMKGGVA